jgi:hypothetical protein
MGRIASVVGCNSLPKPRHHCDHRALQMRFSFKKIAECQCQKESKHWFPSRILTIWKQNRSPFRMGFHIVGPNPGDVYPAPPQLHPNQPDRRWETWWLWSRTDTLYPAELDLIEAIMSVEREDFIGQGADAEVRRERDVISPLCWECFQGAPSPRQLF